MPLNNLQAVDYGWREREEAVVLCGRNAEEQQEQEEQEQEQQTAAVEELVGGSAVMTLANLFQKGKGKGKGKRKKEKGKKMRSLVKQDLQTQTPYLAASSRCR